MRIDKPPHVLMADDDEDDCALAQRAFKESGALGIFSCVEDGTELMESLLDSDKLPDLILLDLNMPRKDGRKTLKEIKSIPEFRNIPLVVLTTSREKEDMAFSTEMGANSFFTKPSRFHEWVEMMKSLADNWLAKKN